MNEITLKLETINVESKSIKTRFAYVIGEPVFGMSKSAYNRFFRKHKNTNLVKRLKNRSI
jgi:hypothetical protein